ncbi:peptide deformylase [Megamonas hypermegale]|mgnify:CR=1 FL=1|uniref:Peptide deformylase n=1 Tax=Megamonas hypermegale TaxID=158847 RepID=A0A921L6P7_9FIRM|nr:peptide deformylase [Megamonas hypermegale]MDM8143755.1 peptide deformylase [Megamonas hypermegale]HJF84134.1 peptide deformylase [Megamonas hypermegale]
MAILDIKKAGDVVLKQQAQPVARIDKKIRTLLDDMAETMYKANGVGLAAPQVGESIQVVVIDVGEGLIELVNPEIVRMEGTETDSEGCLSVPEIYGDVERAAKVSVKYLNRQGKNHRITATGLLARCLQHEIDHLHGRLFIDIAQNLRKVTK